MFNKSDIKNIKINAIFGFVLLSLVLIYFAQGMFYPEGGVVSQSAIILYVCISGVYAISFMKKGEGPDFGYLIIVFLLINTFYWLVSQKVINGFRTLDNYKSTIFIFVTFFPFYYLVKRDLLPVKILRVFIVLFVLMSVFQYKNKEELISYISGRTEVVNNVAYYMVAMLPLLAFFWKKRMVFAGMYVVLLYFAIEGAKRGALITFLVGSLAVFYFYMKEYGKKEKGLNKMINVVLVGIIAYYGYNKYQEDYYIRERLQDAFYGNWSGRDVLYEGILSRYINSDNIINIVFGYGFNASVKMVGNYAHNDWLEILAGQGIVGVILYFLLLYKLWIYCAINFKYFNNEERGIYVAIMIMWFLASIFSMVYTSIILFTYFLCLAYVMATVENRKINKINAVQNVA